MPNKLKNIFIFIILPIILITCNPNDEEIQKQINKHPLPVDLTLDIPTSRAIVENTNKIDIQFRAIYRTQTINDRAMDFEKFLNSRIALKIEELDDYKKKVDGIITYYHDYLESYQDGSDIFNYTHTIKSLDTRYLIIKLQLQTYENEVQQEITSSIEIKRNGVEFVFPENGYYRIDSYDNVVTVEYKFKTRFHTKSILNKATLIVYKEQDNKQQEIIFHEKFYNLDTFQEISKHLTYNEFGKYIIYARVEGNKNLFAETQTITEIVEIVIPEPPKELKEVEDFKTANTLAVQWNPVNLDTYDIKQFNIYLSDSVIEDPKVFMKQNDPITEIENDNNFKILKNLKPETEYNIFVTTLSTFDFESNPSNIIAIKTSPEYRYISGKIEYDGIANIGNNIVEVFDNNEFKGNPLYKIILKSTNIYDISMPMNRNYFIRIWMDSNNNKAIDKEIDPIGYYGNPDSIFLDENKSNINIKLLDPKEIISKIELNASSIAVTNIPFELTISAFNQWDNPITNIINQEESIINLSCNNGYTISPIDTSTYSYNNGKIKLEVIISGKDGSCMLNGILNANNQIYSTKEIKIFVPDLGKHLIIGNISYSEDIKHGDIYVELYNSDDFTVNYLQKIVLNNYGFYFFSVDDGTYYIRAWRDFNNNGKIDGNLDPIGVYGQPGTITVNGNNVENINIELNTIEEKLNSIEIKAPPFIIKGIPFHIKLIAKNQWNLPLKQYGKNGEYALINTNDDFWIYPSKASNNEWELGIWNKSVTINSQFSGKCIITVNDSSVTEVSEITKVEVFIKKADLGLITGLIHYNGDVSQGATHIELYNNSNFSGEPIKKHLLASNEGFFYFDIKDGIYYLRAWKDFNGNGKIDDNYDPVGIYNNSIAVSSDDRDGVSIELTMKDPDSKLSSFYITSPATILANTDFNLTIQALNQWEKTLKNYGTNLETVSLSVSNGYLISPGDTSNINWINGTANFFTSIYGNAGSVRITVNDSNNKEISGYTTTYLSSDGASNGGIVGLVKYYETLNNQSIYVEAFTNPNFTGKPIIKNILTRPGIFVLNLNSGIYYVRSWIDLNNNGIYNEIEEPAGYIQKADGNPEAITVSSNIVVTNDLIIKSNFNAQWGKTTVSANNNSTFNKVTISSDGYIYVCGYIQGTGTFLFSQSIGITGLNNGKTPFILKYDSQGNLIWAKTGISIPNDCSFMSIASSSDNNIYVVGLLSGNQTFDFGNDVKVTPVNNTSTSFLIKYDLNGNAQWIKIILAPTDESLIRDIKIATNGSIIICGSVSSDALFDLGNGINVQGSYNVGYAQNIFIAKYSSSGVPQWAQSTVSATGKSYIYSIDVDSIGNAYVSGIMQGSITLNNNISATSNSTSNDSPLIIKYNSDGIAQWASTSLSGQNTAIFQDVKVDINNNNVYVVGLLSGNIQYDFGNSVYIAGGSTSLNPVIIKYDSITGKALWGRTIINSVEAPSVFYGVNVDSNNNIVAVGFISGNLSYNYGNNVIITGKSSSGWNPIIVKYDETGQALNGFSTDSKLSSGHFNKIVINKLDDSLYISGSISGDIIDLGNNVIIQPGFNNGSNGLCAKYK